MTDQRSDRARHLDGATGLDGDGDGRAEQADRFVLDPATADMHADNDRLRQAGPLVPITAEGVPAWAATRYATLLTVLTHPDMSRELHHWTGRHAMPPGTAIDRIVTDTSLLNAEGERHRRLRMPLTTAFSQRRLNGLRPRIEELTARLIDRLAELLPDQPVDLRLEFAYPLPREVISELIGIPARHQDELHRLTDAVAQVGGLEDSPGLRKELRELLDQIIDERRGTPARTSSATCSRCTRRTAGGCRRTSCSPPSSCCSSPATSPPST
ncbi:hypothetical protein ACFQ0B_43625 [Nonomuraea thailandensis]